jgi:hypothetical protein
LALIVLPIATEQDFQIANTFGVKLVRIVNTGNTSGTVTFSNTISGSGSANLTVLPYTELFVEKPVLVTLQSNSANLLAAPVAFTD